MDNSVCIMAASYAAAASFTASYANDTATDAINIALTEEPSTLKKICCKCNSYPVLNFELKQCLEYLKKMICVKCQKITSDYNYSFRFNYAVEYCEIMCKPQEM